MNLFVGTSGYGYKEWKGSFYPEKLPAKEMLHFYGEQFNSVELNNTFRRMPTADSLTELLGHVPKSFQFAVKAPQAITHFKRLKDVDEPLHQFLEAVRSIKKQCGPLLFQLPPNFKKDLDRLGAFLKLLKKSDRAAFEFRHESWYDDEVTQLLRKHQCALCVADDDDLPKAQVERTAAFGYVRLRRASYSKAQLKKWFKRLQEMEWKDLYIFFKHEETAKGPKFARELLSLAGDL